MRVTKAIALLNLNDSFGVLNPTDFPLVAERPESAQLGHSGFALGTALHAAEWTFTGGALLLANPFGVGALATHSNLARAIIRAVMQS